MSREAVTILVRGRSRTGNLYRCGALGDRSKLWLAEVVLRVPQRDARATSNICWKSSRQQPCHSTPDVPHLPDVSPASSYDIQPPHPDGGVGIACWVRADSVGEAAQTAWDAVEMAVRTFTTEASLWDLRVIPRAAILSAPSTGKPLTR